jgi:TetR/AcrR family transcriptional regulator, acrAB operon repressor
VRLYFSASTGYAAATLEQIAGRAGVTRGALYHHFAGKADLYDALLREQAEQVMGPLLAGLAAEGPPLERLRRFLVAYARRWSATPGSGPASTSCCSGAPTCRRAPGP